MVESSIVVAMIMATGTITAQVIIARINQKATHLLVDYRIKQLEDKVMKYNSFNTRLATMEEHTKSCEARFKRIDDIIRDDRR